MSENIKLAGENKKVKKHDNMAESLKLKTEEVNKLQNELDSKTRQLESNKQLLESLQ